jgi:hypothetical protein
MWKRITNYAHVVLREDGEAVIERTGLEVQMLGRVKECLRNGLEEIVRLQPELTESEILSGLACLADHPLAMAEGYAKPEMAVRSGVSFPPDYDNFVERYRAAEGLDQLEAYQDELEDGFYAAA